MPEKVRLPLLPPLEDKDGELVMQWPTSSVASDKEPEDETTRTATPPPSG